MVKDNISNNWLFEKAISRPLSRAIITRQSALSYYEVYKKCLDAAGYLKSKGVKPNDNVGIIFSHNYEFFIIINALWFLGAVPVPLNTRNTANDISEQIKHIEIKHLIIDEHYDILFRSVSFPDTFYYSEHFVEDFFLKQSNPVDICKFNKDSNALIMFTSGSSGYPKAVVHTFGSLLASVLLTDSFTQFSQDDILLASLPFFHIGGFMILVRGLISGAAVAFPESLRFDVLCESLNNYNPTIASIVPTTLLRFNDNGIKPNSGLRYVFVGGGPASDDILNDAILNGWPVVKVYGSTETCSMITTLPANEISEKHLCAGRGLYGIELVMKNEELLIKSPSLFKEYFNDESETRNKIINGYYHTGDFGRIDEDGYLYIESRREDIIISGGENISSLEIESALCQHECINDVCVVPFEDIVWGQIVCAVIQLKKDVMIGEEELKLFLSGKLASYKIPRKFVFLDRLPRNEMGKIMRKVLMDIIQS